MIDLNDKNFDNTIKSGTVLVDVWATWCGPCKTSMPYFVSFAAAKPGLMAAKMNVDEACGVTEKLHIQSIPTVLLFKDGVEVGRYSGPISKTTLDSLFGEKV